MQSDKHVLEKESDCLTLLPAPVLDVSCVHLHTHTVRLLVSTGSFARGGTICLRVDPTRIPHAEHSVVLLWPGARPGPEEASHWFPAGDAGAESLAAPGN